MSLIKVKNVEGEKASLPKAVDVGKDVCSLLIWVVLKIVVIKVSGLYEVHGK